MLENGNQTSKMAGKQSILFQNPPCIIASSSIAGKKEGEGPLGSHFDYIEYDPMFGKDTWEEAESELMKEAVDKVLQKAGLQSQDIRYLVGGDLLGQLIATSFGISGFNIPLFGIYGACSTMGEAMSIGSMLVDGGFADKVIAVTSSHFAGAEKQFRFPLDYGNQRPYSASWTVTGSGAVVIAAQSSVTANSTEAKVVIKGITTGKIVDYGLKDSMNMGACMAPAAFETIKQNFDDLGILPNYYDKIITGDLGYVGQNILKDMLKEKGYEVNNLMDCGIEIFDKDKQDTHAGGSGCGCSAITFSGYVIKQLREGNWKKVLFVPTGALLSPTSFNEGNTVPGIAHAVMVERA